MELLATAVFNSHIICHIDQLFIPFQIHLFSDVWVHVSTEEYLDEWELYLEHHGRYHSRAATLSTSTF